MKNEDFNELLSRIEEAGKIKRGEIEASRVYEFPEPDVRAIRDSIVLSQSRIAGFIGANVRTLQNWEQGHRHPTNPAKVLLRLVQADPKSVFKNLHANHALSVYQ